MPWQVQVVTVALEVQSETAGDPSPGDWAYDDVGVSTPRQAGKTTLFRPVMVHRCGTPRARVFLTAQNGTKARARWMDLTDDVLSSAYRDQVRRKVSIAHEELRWRTSGATVVPFSPSSEDMHGESPDLVGVDEFWKFTAEQARKLRAAYVPGFLTKNGQAWKTSTAGTAESAWFKSTRKSGRRGVEQGRRLGQAWFEWSLPDRISGVELEDLTDEQLVQAAIDHHPAICHDPACRGRCRHGFTIRPAAIWAAWRELEGEDNRRAEFLRAYGNRDADDLAGTWRAIEVGPFLRAATLEEIPSDVAPALGVDVDPDLADAAVWAAWRDPAGVLRTELLRHDAGAGWVAAYVARVAKDHKAVSIGIRGVGPARDVGDAIRGLLDADVLARVSEVDFAAACSRVLRELEASPRPTWTHRGDPLLRESAEHATTRRVGASGRCWTATGGHTVSVLSGWTIAGWAYDHAPEPADPLPPFWMG